MYISLFKSMPLSVDGTKTAKSKMTTTKGGLTKVHSGRSTRKQSASNDSSKRQRLKNALNNKTATTKVKQSKPSEEFPDDTQKHSEGYQNYEMSEEECAIFQSPLAQQGLHPAFLLGLRPLPWVKYEQDVATHKMQQNVMEKQMALQDLQLKGWPGYEIAMNPHHSQMKCDPPRWPFAPERTVPGYVFEGAEFYKGPTSIRQATKTQTKPPSLLLRWPLNFFSTCLGNK